MKKSKWTNTQIEELREKAKSGNVRLHAFEEIAQKTNRKPNSVRNYYYKNLAEEKSKCLPFSAVAIKQLLREIILGTSRGESVRSICMRLAENDKSKMLRFQNKYRVILRGQPQRLLNIKNELEQQGYLVKLPNQADFKKSHADNVVMLPKRPSEKLTDTDINNLFLGFMRLVKKQAEDGLKSQIETLKSEIETLKSGRKQEVK